MADIAHVIEGFVHADEYSHKAGFDGIELHAANGYILSQFLWRTANKRTDKYGLQNIESRLRLISEIAHAIKSRVPSDFLVAAKLNNVELQDGGALDDFGFDFVELSGGTYENLGYEYKKESTRRRAGYFLEWAETITKSLGKDNKLRTYIVGGLKSVGAMVKALDVVAGISLGRPATVEPHLAIDVIEGRVQGALKAVEAVESDQGMTLVVAPAQISQISRNIEPLDASDVSVM
ncbi:hypothetical protein SCAR479_13318 [Seiridium cardinale]|uniref:NADH:flavin oxidoreductase/NADH oxidase N-terminal domain-containing protein n=1 Tax=Seiridium cardinale TaxID=138064 RepID=A0ABR2X8A2_9PEZI